MRLVGSLGVPSERLVLSDQSCRYQRAIYIPDCFADMANSVDASRRLSSISDEVAIQADLQTYIARAVFDILRCNECQS